MKTIKYKKYLESIPQTGRHILAQQEDDTLLVYQAFRPAIANYAIEHQKFGGAHYSFTRMSWIKPNFLWMMYRAGWAEKQGQEKILAIRIKKSDFDKILSLSVFSSYKSDLYETHEVWKSKLEEYPVRLQWDPDHDIYGDKQERKAIQLGLKGDILKEFATEMIIEIIDVTEFVRTQKLIIDSNNLDELWVPHEDIYLPDSESIKLQIGLIEKQVEQ